MSKEGNEDIFKSKTIVGKILQIYSDANSCHDVLKSILDLFFHKDLILSAMKNWQCPPA